jgi:hypothetical protein
MKPLGWLVPCVDNDLIVANCSTDCSQAGSAGRRGRSWCNNLSTAIAATRAMKAARKASSPSHLIKRRGNRAILMCQLVTGFWSDRSTRQSGSSTVSIFMVSIPDAVLQGHSSEPK